MGVNLILRVKKYVFYLNDIHDEIKREINPGNA
jgi:hypothetical protein